MDVSIIFVNYKTKDLTINAIESVIEKTEGIEYEIFVVDNNSQDGSIEAIEQKFPSINIIKSDINGGFGYANNLAMKQASGKYILCLNTDTLLINNAIKIMFDYMEKEENKNVGICGGYLVNKDNKPCTCGGNFPSITEILFKFGLRKFLNKIYKKFTTTISSDELSDNQEIDYITGADIFFRKSVLEKVGLFDEKFFMYYEETDLCKRIKNCKYDIKFVPNAKIIHLENTFRNDVLNRKKIIKKGELIYFLKHKKIYIPIFVLLYIMLYFF